MIEILKQRWPELFEAKSQPLALGIADKIAAELGCTVGELRKTFGKHCSKPHYIKALSEGVQRRDIDGTLSEVSERHQQCAMEILQAKERRQALGRARRAANSKPAAKAPITDSPAPKPLIVIKKRRVVVMP